MLSSCGVERPDWDRDQCVRLLSGCGEGFRHMLAWENMGLAASFSDAAIAVLLPYRQAWLFASYVGMGSQQHMTST